MQKAVPPPDSPNDHASHGEWYDMYYKEEMTEIEALYKERAGIKTKLTVKKRKKEPSPRNTAKRKVSAVEVLSRVDTILYEFFISLMKSR